MREKLAPDEARFAENDALFEQYEAHAASMGLSLPAWSRRSVALEDLIRRDPIAELESVCKLADSDLVEILAEALEAEAVA